MSYPFYKTVHLVSIFALFMSFGFIVLSVLFKDSLGKFRKFGFALHGASWLVAFISAFGLVSALGLHQNFPTWAKAKTLIWVFLGATAFLIKWKPKWALLNLGIASALGIAAIFFAVYKPML